MATLKCVRQLLPIEELSVTKRDDDYTLRASDGSTMLLESREMTNGRGRVFMTDFDITSGGQLVSIQHHNKSIRHTFSIKNNLGQRMLKLKGPYCLSGSCTFVVYNNNRLALGTITRHGCFSRQVPHEHYNIKFPPNMDVHNKAVVIGAFTLIDTMIDGNICF